MKFKTTLVDIIKENFECNDEELVEVTTTFTDESMYSYVSSYDDLEIAKMLVDLF